jgi:hypothetical protein
MSLSSSLARSRPRPLAALTALLTGLGAAALTQAPAAHADTNTVTYLFTGTEQTFDVPPNVTQVHVVAVGASGGTGISPADGSSPLPGGSGATVSADLPVTGGDGCTSTSAARARTRVSTSLAREASTAGAPVATTAPPVAAVGPTCAPSPRATEVLSALALWWPAAVAAGPGVHRAAPVAAYGLRTATRSAGSGTTAASVAAILSGLPRHTTYHFRLVAVNTSGTVRGVDRSFRTA